MPSYSWDIAIDCPECARKVENGLKAMEGIETCALDFREQRLRAVTKLSQTEVRMRAEALTDELSFPEKQRKYNISIDCPNCARKVENGLRGIEGITDVSLDFSGKTLSLTTAFSDEFVKSAAVSLSDEICFDGFCPCHEEKAPAEPKRIYKVSVDCAACAKKVETYLSSVPGITEVSFDFPKGRLTLTTSLSDEEVMEKAREAEDDIEFLDIKATKRIYKVSIDCAACAKKVEAYLSSVPGITEVSFDFPKGRLTLTTSLSDEEVMEKAREAEDDIEFLADKEEKKETDYALVRTAAAAALFVLAELSGLEHLAVLSWLAAGCDVVWKALKNISKGKVFDENFLMAIATIGALCIQAFDEAAGVMIFYQVGEYFQRRAVGASRRSIGQLMDLKADEAEVLRDGGWQTVPSGDVKTGETIRVKAGERIPIDGTVLEGESHLDMKALTGEPVPVKIAAGGKALSGSINEEGTLFIRTTSVYSDSTASKILKLVEESQGKKAKSERFITRFSRCYTPFVCLSAVLLALLPPVLGLASFRSSLYRACMLLVISCPCALVLSVPLTYFAAMGSFARRGILIRSDESVQNLSKLKILAIDKTGTLTEGLFSVRKVKAVSGTEKELLSYAAALEKNSNHPIAKAIMESCPAEMEAREVTEIAGTGLRGIVDGKEAMIGNRRIIDGLEEMEEDGTVCYVALDGNLAGYIVISDEIRESSAKAIKELKALGVEKTVMLSGDRQERADKTAKAIGMDKALGGLLPQDKLSALESIMEEGKVTAYAGDGINDAPALARADVGIAMGGVGSDAAIEAADVVIMNDDPARLPLAVRIARKTEGIVWQNITGSLIVKAVVFVLALFGLSTMWAAVFADTGVLIFAVLNSLRALTWKE